MLHTEDTIVAIATPPGRGAIAIIRLSGATAFQASRDQIVVKGIEPSHRSVCLGHFKSLEGEVLDEVLSVFFRGPESYTGEDVVEISCHGSPAIAQKIVDVFLSKGLRLAEPGEFTMRAVLNGKIDLLQAEAVQDLVESRTGRQAQLAAKLLSGQLSRVLEKARREVLEVVCQLESCIEFVEEELGLASSEELSGRLEVVAGELEALEESFRAGQIAHDGLQAVLAGKPNVGKSSIFNSLAGDERAIVTPLAGTTRDALKETVAFEGLPVTIVDTAGIRDEQDQTVEFLGVRKALRYLGESGLVLFVIDHSVAYDSEDERIWREIDGRPYLLVVNKIDLPGIAKIPNRVAEGGLATVRVSALEGENVEKLRAEITKQALPASGPEAERPLLTRLRHKNCVERARRELLEGALACRDDLGEELALHHLRHCLNALGELTGEVTTEEILNQVFSTFCIGK